MRAVTIADGELCWAERPDPVPGDTELVVAVRAAGINAADRMQQLGLYPAPPGSPPDVPGLELAGEVVAAGARTTRFGVGDRVMAVVGGGAQAELAAVDEAGAMAVPEGVDWPAAGGFPEAYSTAHDALFTQCGLQVGERVLVTGAAGGVGSAALQLALAAGAHCVASVRDRRRHDALAALGATVAVPEEALGLGPFDVVLELVGGSSLPGVIGAMRTGGRVAVIGLGGGARAEVDLGALMHRRVRISASTLRARSLHDKAAVARAVEHHVVPLLAAGRVRVLVEAALDMARAAEAYARFAQTGKLGKIVLVRAGG
ncbi:MAG TPA: zinc-binding dehydrogenase [Acidimicrobiales bacterium]|nr:zinc-binding dehydrogenase [Acidimicrobiales bacterium]